MIFIANNLDWSNIARLKKMCVEWNMKQGSAVSRFAVHWIKSLLKKYMHISFYSWNDSKFLMHVDYLKFNI